MIDLESVGILVTKLKNHSFTVPPVLKQVWGTGTEGELCIRKGDSLSLHCDTENTTVADITWYKDDEPLAGQQSSSRNMINIPEVTGDDFGVYECKAQNALGVTSMKMKVVNGKFNK